MSRSILAVVVVLAATHSAVAARPSNPMAAVAQTIERENSPQDKLKIEVSRVAQADGQYVVHVRVVWGDLDNLIKTCGRQYYSNWDGSLSVDHGSATVTRKIQFDDGGRQAAAGTGAATQPARPRPARLPGPGSGRDQLLSPAGPTVAWQAGVVGVLDGLLIRITSPSPTITGTIHAGNFSVPFAAALSPGG